MFKRNYVNILILSVETTHDPQSSIRPDLSIMIIVQLLLVYKWLFLYACQPDSNYWTPGDISKLPDKPWS